MPDGIIEAKNLCVRYRGVEALSDLSFSVEKGDYLGIVGPNGSGKTSLVKAILGLVPFDGEILFSGMSLSSFTKSRHIGYLPQKMSFLDQRFPASTREIVVSGVYCCKKFPKRLSAEDWTAADEAMKTLGIQDLANRPIGRLSGGQQQRALLARALVHHPELLILDEPTVALDPLSRQSLHSSIEMLNRERRVTVLMVSHDSVSIRGSASKILYLDKKLVFFGRTEDFGKSPRMLEYFGVAEMPS